MVDLDSVDETKPLISRKLFIALVVVILIGIGAWLIFKQEHGGFFGSQFTVTGVAASSLLEKDNMTIFVINDNLTHTQENVVIGKHTKIVKKDTNGSFWPSSTSSSSTIPYGTDIVPGMKVSIVVEGHTSGGGLIADEVDLLGVDTSRHTVMVR